MPESTYDPNDLANGYYPHLRKVSINDPEWNDIMAWFGSKGIPGFTRLVAEKGYDPTGFVRLLPTEAHWTNTKQGDNPLKLDAAMVFNFPHVALVELKEAYQVGDPKIVEMYPGIRKPVEYVEYSPIGVRWPERDENGQLAFRPSQADTEAYGATFHDSTGTYRKERKGWAFISYPIWFKV